MAPVVNVAPVWVDKREWRSGEGKRFESVGVHRWAHNPNGGRDWTFDAAETT